MTLTTSCQYRNLIVKKLNQEQIQSRLNNYNIKLLDTYINSRSRNKLKCFCGKEFSTLIGSFLQKDCRSCGCQNRRIDITNKRFNKLVAIKPAKNHVISNNSGVRWECLCDCGKITTVSVNKLKSGNTKSCGCIKEEHKKNIGNIAKKYYSIHTGIHHPSYNHEMTDEERVINNRRPLIAGWRNKVFRKFGRKCCICNSKENLRVHHKDGWHWCKERRYDVDNGVVLCEDCHTKYHQKFGYYNNTEIQFNEYLNG